VQAGTKQGLVGVDVAQAGQKALVEQQGLEHPRAPPNQADEDVEGEILRQRFRPKPAQHDLGIAHQPHPSELALILEAERGSIVQGEDHSHVFL